MLWKNEKLEEVDNKACYCCCCTSKSIKFSFGDQDFKEDLGIAVQGTVLRKSKLHV